MQLEWQFGRVQVHRFLESNKGVFFSIEEMHASSTLEVWGQVPAFDLKMFQIFNSALQDLIQAAPQL